jgi:hypothetical protein
MNAEISFKTFIWAVIVGMGLHIGWGLISLIVWVLAKSLNVDAPVLH